MQNALASDDVATLRQDRLVQLDEVGFRACGHCLLTKKTFR